MHGFRGPRHFPLLLTAGCLLPLSVACTTVMPSASTPDNLGLTVSGTGRAVADPDIAMANIGVEVRDADPRRAVELNNKQMSLLIANLKGMGIQDSDLQTSNFSISFERPPMEPRVERTLRTSTAASAAGKTEVLEAVAEAPSPQSSPHNPAPEGWFVVNNTLRVKVRDLGRLGDVLSTATTAGANSIWGVELQLENPDPLLFHARDQAVEDAIAKAKRLAEASGMQLGRVLSIEESGAVSPGPRGGMLFAREAKTSIPIEAGALELSAAVTMRFALENKPLAPSTASPAQ